MNLSIHLFHRKKSRGTNRSYRIKIALLKNFHVKFLPQKICGRIFSQIPDANSQIPAANFCGRRPYNRHWPKGAVPITVAWSTPSPKGGGGGGCRREKLVAIFFILRKHFFKTKGIPPNVFIMFRHIPDQFLSRWKKIARNPLKT